MAGLGSPGGHTASATTQQDREEGVPDPQLTTKLAQLENDRSRHWSYFHTTVVICAHRVNAACGDFRTTIVLRDANSHRSVDESLANYELDRQGGWGMMTSRMGE